LAYTVHDPQAFYAAILARIGTSTGKQVGLAVAPDANVYPYAVVYPLVDESQEGSLNNPTQAVTWSWQVTCVSNGAAGAQWMQQKVRTALHGFTPTVAGLGTTPIELVDGSGVTRDDSISPPLFYSTDRFIDLTSI
jgi:hypothetical protein